MKSTLPPLICGVTVAAISAAGFSHWWSVRQFIAALGTDVPVAHATHATRPAPAPVATASGTTPVSDKAAPAPAPAASTGQQDFYDALLSRMDSLQNQNRDLLDQLAETNRDLMKLEFRVDTHSESFRPLPVTEDQPFTNLDGDDIGVLPPRAEPVILPTQE